MIHWLLQDSSADADLARGVPPEGLLSAAEEQQFATFKSDKRRREWLLGRWTAKHLYQSVIRRESNKWFTSRELTIANDADGVPFATWENRAGAGLPGFTLSISHRGAYALCALVQNPPGSPGPAPLGADIELIEHRSETFVRDYLTPPELDRLASTSPLERDEWITAIWSGKESALKALRLGLSVDTRAVTCLPEHDSTREPIWRRLSVCCNIEWMPRPCPELRGWWRKHNGYVLTLVASADEEGPAAEPG